MKAALLALKGPINCPNRSSGSSADRVTPLILLGMALVLIWTGRAYGPLFLQRCLTPAPLQSAADVGLLLAAGICATVAHECGHLAAATGLGFHVMGASLGPLRIDSLHGKWKFSLRPSRWFAASVSAIPSTMRCWKVGMLIVIAAGPIATLASGLAAATLVETAHSHVFAREFVQVSLLLFLLGLIPNHRQSASRNDARMFWDLASSQASVEEMELYVELSQQVVQGVRTQDYSDPFVSKLAAWRGRADMEYVFAQTLVRWAVDSNRPELADSFDARALSLSSRCHQGIRNAALTSSACFDVVFRNDIKSARSKFERVRIGTLFPPCVLHLARACNYFATGANHLAPRQILLAQYALPRGIGWYSVERLMLDRLHMQVLRSASPRAGLKARHASA